MRLVDPAPAFLASQHGRHPGGVDHPPRGKGPPSPALAHTEALERAGVNFDTLDHRRTNHNRASIAGASQHLLIEPGAVELVARDADEITAANLPAIDQRLS